mgnify:CR=1 FL=1
MKHTQTFAKTFLKLLEKLRCNVVKRTLSGVREVRRQDYNCTGDVFGNKVKLYFCWCNLAGERERGPQALYIYVKCSFGD